MENIGKFKPCARHEAAVLHAVGQTDTIRLAGATVADIARFMNVTKPTAKKYLDKMASEGKLIKSKFKHGRFGRLHYWLSDVASEMYAAGEFEDDYKLYVQRVLKVVI